MPRLPPCNVPMVLASALVAGLLLVGGAVAAATPLAATPPARLADGAPARLADGAEGAITKSRAAIGRVLADHLLSDVNGAPVRLSSFKGRPVVLSLIYTSCPDACPLIIEHLADAVEIATEALGKGRFTVLTVGFDARHDTPRRMRLFAAERGLLRRADWHFLAADAETAAALAEDTGFSFVATPWGFDHTAQATLIDASGRVAHQVMGADFNAPFMVEPLKNLVFGQDIQLTSWQGVVNRVKLFCTVYDPATGRYRFDYSLFIVIAIGSVSLGGVGYVVVRNWWRLSRRGGRV